ncbi:hypothetical protein GINT2_000261 [Glugoides intestinalis]
MHFLKLLLFFTPHLFLYMPHDADMAVAGSQLKVIDDGNTFSFWNLFRAKRILLELIIVVRSDMKTNKLSVRHCAATCSYSEFNDLNFPHYGHMDASYKLVRAEFSIADDPFEMSPQTNKSVSILYANTEVRIFDFNLKNLLENSKLIFFETKLWQGKRARGLIKMYNKYVSGLPSRNNEDSEDSEDAYGRDGNQYSYMSSKSKNYRFNPRAY